MLTSCRAGEPEVASNWRENDRVAEVASLTPSKVEVEAPHKFDTTVADSDDEQRDPMPVEEVPVAKTTESLCSGASDPHALQSLDDLNLVEVFSRPFRDEDSAQVHARGVPQCVASGHLGGIVSRRNEK